MNEIHIEALIRTLSSYLGKLKLVPDILPWISAANSSKLISSSNQRYLTTQLKNLLDNSRGKTEGTLSYKDHNLVIKLLNELMP